MNGLMHHESPRLTKALLAYIALERLLFRVNVSVISEVILASECLAAYVAWIRPLVRVSSLVNEQVVGLGEVASAEFTNVFLAFAFGGNLQGCGLVRY